MLRHVHLHLFRKSLTVEEIKEACRCKNNNIVTFFKQELETDIRRYIASRRLDAAEYVMRRKKVTISLLASCVGYTEELFWRDFKAEYGCTPLEFMKVNCEELRSAQTVEMPGQEKKQDKQTEGNRPFHIIFGRSSRWLCMMCLGEKLRSLQTGIVKQAITRQHGTLPMWQAASISRAFTAADANGNVKLSEVSKLLLAK